MVRARIRRLDAELVARARAESTEWSSKIQFLNSAPRSPAPDAGGGLTQFFYVESLCCGL
jgi:hypothetical protein